MHYRNIPKTLLFLLLCCPSMGLTGCSAVVQGDTGSFSPADYVNPFIGASTSTSAAGAPAGFDVPCINRFEISLKLPSFRSGNAPTKKRLHLMWEAHGCRVYVAHLVGLSVPPLKVEA